MIQQAGNGIWRNASEETCLTSNFKQNFIMEIYPATKEANSYSIHI